MEQYSNLAQKLIDQRLVSDNEMERVVRLQQEQQAPLTRLIVEMGLLSEDDLLPVLRDHYALPLISLKDQPTTPLSIEFPSGIAEFLRTAHVVPVKIEGRDLIVATSNPLELSRLHALEVATGLRVKPVLAKDKDITLRIEALFGNGSASDSAQRLAGRGRRCGARGFARGARAHGDASGGGPRRRPSRPTLTLHHGGRVGIAFAPRWSDRAA